ncbi:DUF1499 domain-containing protein [Gemmobacter serpentinus]|uniref:DUF1499 domain-containing protein n=1 Tax=Gemmobacter serpentinus TaxID=2652247 RepID=UPI00124D163A|nr:DUF1499 domain-containing protein [Gemmobacter serpentinus]
MKWIVLVTFGLPLLAALVFIGFVRLAPVDPGRWHVALTDHPASIKPNDASAYATGGDLAAPILRDTPEVVLAKLEQIALAEPRLRHVAGSPSEGRITFLQRSRLWGIPDFITAEATSVAEGTRLEMWSRARFGYWDGGANLARLERWIAALQD